MIRLLVAMLLVLATATGCNEVKPDEVPGSYGTPNRGRGA